MYFDVGIHSVFEDLDDSEYAGFCLTAKATLGSVQVPKKPQSSTSKRIYSKVEIDVFLEDIKSLQLTRFHEYEVLSVKILEEEVLKHACNNWDMDLITFDLSQVSFPFKNGYIRKAINRGIFFEVVIRDALYDTKRRVSWIKNARSLLRITKGRNTVVSSGATCATELKHVQDIYKLLRFVGLSHSRAELVLDENPCRLLKSCALKRYAFKGCIANNIEETNLKKDFILKDFGF